MIAYYLTHPQVEINADVPVPQWSLSAKGRSRLQAICDATWLRGVRRIVSSDERKAVETAAILGAAVDVEFEVGSGMGENDRSATGFLRPDAFEAAADEFFAKPEASRHGWERAVDAQRRIVAAVEAVLASHGRTSPVLFAGHGAVGTLLKCSIARRPISRKEDQPGGGGNIFAFGLATRRLLCEWTPMEEFDGVSDEGRNA